MNIAARNFADVVIATPAGAIDHFHAQDLERALVPLIESEAPPRALVLDFKDVNYVSSMGLRVLMVAAKALRARNARIAVAALQPVVVEIFDIARFSHVLEVFPTVRDAVAALSPAALAAWDASR